MPLASLNEDRTLDSPGGKNVFAISTTGNRFSLLVDWAVAIVGNTTEYKSRKVRLKATISFDNDMDGFPSKVA